MSELLQVLLDTVPPHVIVLQQQRTEFGVKTQGSLCILFAPFHLSSASFNATFMADSIFAPAADSSEGMGTPKNKGDFKVEEDIDTQQNARRETQRGGSLDQLRCFHR